MAVVTVTATRSKKQSSIITDLAGFRKNARGWVEVEVKDLREFFEPLRRREWTDVEKKRMKDIADEGGAFALQEYYRGYRDAELRLEKLGIIMRDHPEWVEREQLEAVMQRLITKCKRDGWTSAGYAALKTRLSSAASDTDKVDWQFISLHNSACQKFRDIVSKYLDEAAAIQPHGAHQESGGNPKDALQWLDKHLQPNDAYDSPQLNHVYKGARQLNHEYKGKRGMIMNGMKAEKAELDAAEEQDRTHVAQCEAAVKKAEAALKKAKAALALKKAEAALADK